jgi:hypothetical protein
LRFGFEQTFVQKTKKRPRKTLMKLTPGVNFIIILPAHLSHENKSSSFSLDSFGFVNFWHQNIGKKEARKMLMKLIPVDLPHA